VESHEKDTHRYTYYKKAAIVDGIHVLWVQEKIRDSKYSTAALGNKRKQQQPQQKKYLIFLEVVKKKLNRERI